MRTVSDLTSLLARALLSALFLWSGVTKAMAPAATQATFAKMGITAVYLAYAAAVFIEVAVALALLVGWRTRIAAVILAIWCVVTAGVAHFQPAIRAEVIQFLKNLAMAGGFLFVALHGPGRFALDRR